MSPDGKSSISFAFPGSSCSGIAWDGENVWLSDAAEKKVFRIDPKDGHVLFSLAFEGELGGVAWDGKHVWQAERSSRTVSQVDADSGEILKAIRVEHPMGELAGLCQEGDSLWVALSGVGQIRRMKVADGGFMKAYPTRSTVTGVAVVGKHLYYADMAEGKVHKLDIPSGSLLISYDVGGKPAGICHDGKNFWIADADAKTVRCVKL